VTCRRVRVKFDRRKIEGEMNRHHWTEEDDLIALYLSRHGSRFLPMMEAGIAKLRGIREGSLTMRQQNFRHLDGERGLPNVAKLSRYVHERYGRMNEIQLRPLVLGAINAKE
jgi:hypothetical protein